MKRSIALLLVLSLALPLPALGAENAEFVDVSPSDWFAPYVEVCVKEGLMQGTGEGKFSPEQYVTSAECVLLATRLDKLLKGENGPLPKAPEGWGTVVITDESGNVRFTREDYRGYSFNSEGYAIWLTQERVDPLAGQVGTLVLNGVTVHEGQFAADEENKVRFYLPKDSITYREFDAITDGYYQQEQLLDAPEWVLDGLYYAEEAGLDLGDLRYDLYPADRLSFLTALEGVMDPRELEKINTVEALPDVPTDHYIIWTKNGRSGTNGNFGDFYRAGILSGTDEYGTFKGNYPLSRAECAAMLARLLRPELRMSFTLTPYPWKMEYELKELGLSSRSWWNEGEVRWSFPDTVEHPLDQQVLRVSPGRGSDIEYDKCGIFSMDGQWLVEVGRYEDLGCFGSDGLAMVSSSFSWFEGQYGVINTEGKEVLPAIYDGISLGGDGVIAAYVEAEDTYLLFDSQGQQTGQFFADGTWIRGGFREGLALFQAEETDLWGYMDLTGQIVIPAQYEVAGLFYEGLAAVVIDGKTGYIDRSGELVIPCQFQAIEQYDECCFRDGAAIVTDSEGWDLVIDRTGAQISPHRYDLLDDSFSPNGLAFYQLWDDPEEGFLQGFVDTQGIEHPTPDYCNPYQIMAYSGGYYLINWSIGSYNYMDAEGNILFPVWFGEASPLTEDGQAIVLREDGEYCRLELKQAK